MFIKNLISQRGTKPNVFLFFICLVSFSLSLSGQSLFNSLEKNTKTPAQKQNYQPQVKTLENQIPSLSTYREDLKQVDPDFAVWLDKQIEIMEMQVRSLNFDLANLSPKSDRYSIVIESQLEDLEYLLKTVREKSEFLIKDSAFNIQKKTISITDYGNLEEIKKNASPFLKKAIAESQRSGRNRIIFPDGVFKFNDLNNTDFAAAGQHLLSYRNAAMVKKNKTGKQIVSHIPLVGVSNLSITGGKETKFLFMHAQTGIFILQSKNILIKNIKFDYNIPHYTQGTIEKIVDKQTYILKIEEGFPPATLKPFKNMKGFHPVVRTAHGDTIENGRYPWGAPVGSYHNYTKIDDLGNNRYRCRLNKPIASRLKPGTRAIYYFRKVGHGNPVYVEDSDSVFFDNIAMYSGFAAGFIKYIRSGFLMIKNCMF